MPGPIWSSHSSHSARRVEHRCERRRERENGRGEDHRDDAAGVHLERDVGARPAVHPAADDSLGVLNRDPPVPAFDEDDGGDHERHHDDQERQPDRSHLTGAKLVERDEHRTRQPDDDPGEDDQRHAVADPAFRDLFPEPHDEGRAGRQCENGHQAESPARAVDERQAAGHLGVPLEEDRDAHGLHDRQQNRPVACVLGDLAATELPFFRQPLQIRPDDGQQLQDDRRADVRHDAEREDRHLRQVLSREHVVQPENAGARALHQRPERLPVDAGGRDLAAHPVHGQQPQREQHAVAQLRNGEDVLDAFDHDYASTSVVPPAAAIFSAALPLNLWARMVNAFEMSPRPSTLTR